MSYNCRSIRNKVAGVLDIIKDNEVDICCLQETYLRKADGSIISEIKDSGLDILTFRKSFYSTHGGGVAILSKKSIKVDRVPGVFQHTSFESIECLIATKEENIRLVNIYRTPSTVKNHQPLSVFNNELSNYLDKLSTLPGHVVLVGDFNIHVEDVNSTNYTKNTLDFINILSEHELEQLVHQPTHVLDGTLDLVIKNKDPNYITDISVLKDVGSSDHYPILFNVLCNPLVTSEKVTFTTRNWHKVDIEQFILELKQDQNITCPDEQSTLEELVHNLNSALLKVADKLCPENTKTIRNRPKQKWFDKGLVLLKHIMRRAERQNRKKRSESTWNEVVETRKIYEEAVTSTRCNYYTQQIENSDKKSLYKTLNYLSGEDNSTILPSSKDDKSLANKFNDYFSNKIENIRKKIHEDQANLTNKPTSSLEEVEPNCTFASFTIINLQDLKRMIKEMSSKFNPDDPVPTSIFKQCLEVLGPIVLTIINKSLKESTFPLMLKKASMRPLIKNRNGDKEDLKNYRPISNTPFLAKLLEKAALDQINEYIICKQLHSPFQSGYRTNHSCETALLKITDDVLNAIRKKKMCCLVLLDMSAAFDTVDHSILLNKLKGSYGINGEVLNWITSYLKDRTFAVTIGKTKANELNMLYGVPQGSLLGPLLFILYTKDVARIAKKHGLKVQLYADDTQLYLAFDPLVDFDDMEQKFSECIQEIRAWMSDNFLKLNIDKTDIIFFGSRFNTKANANLSIQIGGDETIMPKDGCVKTLGVKLDENLTMKNQVNSILQSGYYHLKRFHRLRYYLDRDTKLTIVTSFILSKMDYCNSLLAPVTKECINKLQKLINACVRFIYNLSKRSHVSEYAKNLHILPAKQRIHYKLCIVAYKIINGQAPPYLSNFIIPKVINRTNLRSEEDYFMMQPLKPTNDISSRMTKLWNNLPYDIRCSSNIDDFKGKLKTFYFKFAYNI